MGRMRVAFFGGTFDPIHRGHLAIAVAAADALALDQVLFAPAGRQPLKSKPSIASYDDRLAMVRLALEGSSDARCVASTLDGPRPDGLPNYTVDALEALHANDPQAALFAIAGADSFLTLGQWRSPGTLLSLAQWIVVSRPEFPLTEAQLAPLGLKADQRERVHLLTTVHEEISATELRIRLGSGDPCAGLLPAEVAAYIQRRGLYR